MNQGELVLANFPFSDLSKAKVRPALIVSNDRYNASGSDLLVCAITSNPKSYEYAVSIESSDMDSGRLLVPSKIKSDKLMLMAKSQIIKTLGKLSKQKFAETKQKIVELISDETE